MAIKPDYDVGTASLANGATTITFAGGANITAADIQPGDTFKVQNLDAVIATITDATHVELAEPWTGTTLAAAPYRIRYQSDGSRYAAALGYVRSILGQSNVSALAGLTGAADKIAYFTGAGTMALADFKTWARSLFSLTPAADQIAYFSGAGTAALTSFKAWTRSMLGLTVAANKAVYFTDANTAALMDVTAAGRALLDDADASAQLTTLGLSTFVKTLMDDSNAAAFYATLGTVPDAQISATLTPDKAFRRGNILGTVSQTSGVPTGALIESGVNANGTYAKFADGTLICSRSLSGTAAGPGSSSFTSLSWAASFVSTPFCCSNPLTTLPHLFQTSLSAAATSFVAAVGYQASGSTAINITVTAFGRWF